MKTANQLTFTTYEASLKLRPNDPIKIIFDNIDWSFIHPMVNGRYSPQGAEGYDPISLFKAQLLIYLGEVNSDRKLASALRYNGRLCLLCGFNFLRTPSNGTFTNFRDRLGEDIFYEILHQLIAQAIVLKVIIGGDTAIDSSQSYPVISLRNNAGYIHHKPVGYHDHPNPPVIPNEKDNRENKNHPMRELSPASFQDESSYVHRIRITKMLLPESTFRYGGAIWQKSFPCFDS